MRKAYDAILSDYVDAKSAAQSGGFEPYRYECARCWEEVRLCAADSYYQATHFRHRSGNNNVECDNYLGTPGMVISNALSRRNIRDKIEFYFSSDTKMFYLGVKFSAEEIIAHEQSGAVFQLRSSTNSKPSISIPIKNNRFLSDISELIPINDFSWEYYISSTNDSKQQKYELFRKDKRNTVYPSFFKILATGDDDNFQAKLVRTETLYTNIPYFIVFTHQYHTLSFQNDVKDCRVVKFSTMNRDFAGVIVTFINKTARVEQQLNAWKYRLETNETLTLLWPPSLLVDDVVFIKSKDAYISSSFEIQAHGNVNINSVDITKLGNGISKILINKRTKIYKKNSELVLNRYDDPVHDCDILMIAREQLKKYQSSDDNTYLFNNSGVSLMSKGMPIFLTPASEVRHYSFSYLDCVITADQKVAEYDNEHILQIILMYYKREEELDCGDYDSLSLTPTALQYIESCKKIGKINSAAKRFIEEGRL